MDPSNQSYVFAGQSVPICAANMGAGDRIPTAQLTINDTLSRSYSGGLREINHVEWNGTCDWGNCCFDRETGMPVEFLRTHRFTNNDNGEVVLKTDVINLISTNRWEINNSKLPSTLYFVIWATGIIAFFSLIAVTYRLVTRKANNRSDATKNANYK